MPITVFSLFLCSPVISEESIDPANPELKKVVGYRSVVACQDEQNPLEDVSNCSTNKVLLHVWYPVLPSALPFINDFVPNNFKSVKYNFLSDLSGIDHYSAISANDLDFFGVSQVEQFNVIVNSAPLISLAAITKKDGKPLNVSNAHKPHPLIIFSTGWIYDPTLHPDMMEALAMEGFIVVSPIHRGNSNKDALLGSAYTVPFEDFDQRRNAELKFALEWALAANNNVNHFLHKKIDTNQIGAGGYSYGGGTMVSSFVNDTRIKVFGGFNAFFNPNTSLPPVSHLSTKPAFMITGTLDVSGAKPGVIMAHMNGMQTPKADKYLLIVEGAGHASAVNPCYQLSLQFPPASNNMITNLENGGLANGFMYFLYQVGAIPFLTNEAGSGCPAPWQPTINLHSSASSPNEYQKLAKLYLASFYKAYLMDDILAKEVLSNDVSPSVTSVPTHFFRNCSTVTDINNNTFVSPDEYNTLICNP